MNIVETIIKRSRTFITVMGFVLFALVWIIDYKTGPEFSSLILYLVPIIFVTCFVGRWTGIFMAVACSAAWLLTDAIAKYPYPHIIIPFWNLIEKLGIFLILVYILMNYPAASRRGINYGHSRDLLIGNPWFDKSGFRLKKLPE